MMWIIFALLLKVKTLPIYCNLHKVFVRCYSQFVMYFSGENSFHVSGFSLKLATDFRTTWSQKYGIDYSYLWKNTSTRKRYLVSQV